VRACVEEEAALQEEVGEEGQDEAQHLQFTRVKYKL
jgi:hypothetical protein